MKILITGAAGFIGAQLVNHISKLDYEIVGLDNINPYYDVNLKFSRLSKLTGIEEERIEYNRIIESSLFKNYRFIKLSLDDGDNLFNLFNEEKFDIVCNLAAQAGVRYSIENPNVYVNSNIIGFLNVLEGCRHNNVKHLVYASSSSVYGLNENYPFKVTDGCNHPVSIYAATKKSNELMAHTYSHLFNLPTTGLRFFTVYGPWGRPDMSPFLFANAIKNNIPIKIFNNGDMMRDFTYVDDVVEGLINVIKKPSIASVNWNPASPNPAESSAPYRIYNIGNSVPIKLLEYIETIEKSMNKIALKEFLPLQPGDVLNTFSDVTELQKDFGYTPSTKLQDGINAYVKWFNSYYKD